MASVCHFEISNVPTGPGPWFPGWGCLRRVQAPDNNRPICIISLLTAHSASDWVLSFFTLTHCSRLIPRSEHVTMI